jgi:tRNA (adenine22-N1)-methyltransferase
MTTVKLSERLKQLVDWIPQGAILADIGSDHAYLPTYAIKEGKIHKAIAGEVNQGPFESAVATVHSMGLAKQIQVRKGDGLDVLSIGEVNTIVIAGMGGALIRSILDKGEAKLASDTLLILQPNNGEETLRHWLQRHNWPIQKEAILQEDGHLYEAMVAKKRNGPSKDMTPDDLLFGPFLRREKNELFVKKWSRELAKWQGIIKSVHDQAGESEEKQTRLEEIKQHIKRIEEAIE